MGVVPLAFEIEDGIHDVLEGLRTGEAALLGNVAHQQDRNVPTLRREQELRRRLAHLSDAARRRLKLQREDRLN